MNIAFYVDEMNLRGVANSSYQFAFYNKKILKNKSYIFYNQKNSRNKKEVIKKFKKQFKIIGIQHFNEIDKYKDKFLLNYVYVQKSGDKRDGWVSKEIKTLIHSVYPQKLNQVHGHKYIYISEWLSKNFSNNKIPFIPLITDVQKNKNNLKKKLKIKKNQIVFGCYGGESSFDLQFVKFAISEIVKKRNDIIFIFLNINKFIRHKQIKFLKGTLNENFKKKFINSCDAMIYGRSLGESFGLSCGEFAISNKRVISYKYNRHKSHSYNIPSKYLSEYSSFKSLSNIILNFEKQSLNYKSLYKKYTKKNVINDFQNIFLRKNQSFKFSLYDYAKNYLSFIKMNYYYFRHKLYVHYFNYFEKHFVKNKH